MNWRIARLVSLMLVMGVFSMWGIFLLHAYGILAFAGFQAGAFILGALAMEILWRRGSERNRIPASPLPPRVRLSRPMVDEPTAIDRDDDIPRLPPPTREQRQQLRQLQGPR